MNKDEINQLIQNPNAIDKNDIEGIELLLKKYPYFNGGVHLLAKAHTTYSSLEQGQKTKQSVLYAGNRLTIKNFLQNTDSDNPVKTKHKTEESPIISSLPSVEISKEIQLENNEENNHLEVHFTNHLSNFNPEMIENKQHEESKELELPTLRYYVHLPEFGKDLRISKDDLISDYMRFRKTEEITPVGINEQAEIIQKFIEVSPSISRIEHNVPAESGKIDLSQKSTIVDEELVSETLANILLKQEKYKKAIEIFEKLILKYPDKSTYFAAQIQQTRLKLK